MLEVDRINTYYGEFRALKDVSVNVKEGELVVVFGPNVMVRALCSRLSVAYSLQPRAM